MMQALLLTLVATNSASAASLTQLIASTITVSSLSALLAYTSTLTVGTILNFSAGGSLGTNLILSGSLNALSGSVSTLTVGSLSTTYLQASTLSASTYLNVVFNQTISSSGTTSTTYSAGTLAVGGGGSFAGTLTAACFTNQASPQYQLDMNGSARIVTSGALPLLIQTGSSTSNGLQIQLSGTGGAQDVGIGFNQAGITSYGIVQRGGVNGRLAFVKQFVPRQCWYRTDVCTQQRQRRYWSDFASADSGRIWGDWPFFGRKYWYIVVPMVCHIIGRSIKAQRMR